MADMALDRLLRQVEAVADLPVDETLRDELENLDLARRRQMLDFRRSGRAGKSISPATGFRRAATV